jgi:phosphatidylglycerophosphatase A
LNAPPEANPHYPRSDRHTLRVPTAFPGTAEALEKFEHLISIGGPIGFVPWVPATWASLATALAWWGASASGWLPAGDAASLTIFAVGIALFFIGARTATTSERLLGIEDARNVVIDEVAGQSLAFLAAPPRHWGTMAAGFVLFRIFDVVKPFPARRAERLPSGWGVMADDMIAGAYAAIALWAIGRWL